MTLSEVLVHRRPPGRRITSSEAHYLVDRFGSLAARWLCELLMLQPLVGSAWSLPTDADESGLGAEVGWMSPEQMVSEAIDFYPGIAALRRGFVPVGTCLEGSGDPYFLEPLAGEDPPLVRVVHDAIGPDLELLPWGTEIVTSSLSLFFARAAVK